MFNRKSFTKCLESVSQKYIAFGTVSGEYNFYCLTPSGKWHQLYYLDHFHSRSIDDACWGYVDGML